MPLLLWHVTRGECPWRGKGRRRMHVVYLLILREDIAYEGIDDAYYLRVGQGWQWLPAHLAWSALYRRSA